jgi:asparagine synthase (glutamine-hydrolysing)
MVASPEQLDRMTDVMTHRGPNDRGTYTAPGIALGVRRLSIVDVEGGHQPVSNEDGLIWAVQNGELYNHADVRRDLTARGHSIRSRCDTEILPHLYEESGDLFPQSLRGMFGLAVWDGRRRRAVLARDRIGIKPLYYACVGDLVVFASELKSLLASGLVEPRLDYEGIHAYLAFGFFPGPSTPLEGVRKLMQGHVLLIGDGGVREERYWSYPPPNATPPRSLHDVSAELLDQLEESVRLRLMSDVPLGAMLSGGLDSSLIVALMARNMTEPVKTFSIGFAEAGSANELADARVVAKAFGAEHHELELSFAEESVDLEDLVWCLDEPLADLSALGFLALSELASRSVTVALSGQGADELLGGYRKHRAASMVPAWHRLPRALRRAGTGLASLGPPKLQRAARMLAAPDAVERLLAMSSQLDEDLAARLFQGKLTLVTGNAARDAVAARATGVNGDALAGTLHIDGQLALVDDMLHYFDRTSMAHSLEVRVPFLDHEVVEFCATIEPRHKVRRLETKVALKHAARGLIPDQIIDKPKIGFFRNSAADWFSAQTESAIPQYLLDPGARYSELLDQREVASMVADHTSGRGAHRTQLLLALLMLEVWLSSYLPRATGVREDVAVPA